MEQQFTNMRDLVRGFAGAMNLISPEVEDHHQKVAYLAYRLAEAAGLSPAERRMTLYAALLHDIGAVTLKTDRRLTLAEVESDAAFLAKAGSALLRMHPMTERLSEVVGMSQSPWQRLTQLALPLRGPLLQGQLVHMADTITLLLSEEGSVLNQVGHIRECIGRTGKREFGPQALEALDSLCRRDDVWMDVLYRPDRFLDDIPASRAVSLDETIRMAELVSHVIDFRSPFTAMHSAGVAASAEALARLSGMSQSECKMMRIAGSLHDLGKLKIPREILEKPGRLTDGEFNQIKEHAYYTYVLLKDIRGFEQICEWAAFHHEKLNGTGYPFRLKAEQIPLGARIMAVADVFSAITEKRPYRDGMPRERAVAVLRENAAAGALAESLVELLAAHYDEIDAARDEASRAAGKRYFASIEAKREN